MKKMMIAVMTTVFLASCNINQTKKAELPEIDVDVETEAGQLPDYEVNWADVNVGTTTKTVTIPKVVVVMEEEEVEVPYIDVDMPDNEKDLEKEEQTIMVEAEVSGKEHAIDIKEIRAVNNKLVVISELKEEDQTLGNQKIRVSDQVTLNAPDLNIKYYIVGEKPDRVFNTKYKYFATKGELDENLKEDYKVIYSK